MHHYHSPLPKWSPWWLIAIWAFIILVVGTALYEGAPHHEVGVRHPLPDPYAPQCYAVEWRSGEYCEFLPVKRHYRN